MAMAVVNVLVMCHGFWKCGDERVRRVRGRCEQSTETNYNILTASIFTTSFVLRSIMK